MIESYLNKALQEFFESGKSRGLNPNFLKKIALILDALDSAENVEDLIAAGYGVHSLTGDRKKQWSMVVSRNWRITFTFEDRDVFDVDYEDYHG